MTDERARTDPELCKHGYSTYTDAAGRVHIATGGRCTDVPVPADAARDARVAARRAADARKAGAALDRLAGAPASPVLAVEQTYDAITIRLRDGTYQGVSIVLPIQHNRDSGVAHYVGIPSGPGEVTLTSVRPSGFTGPMHDTCIETTGYGEVLAGTRSWVCGQECPGVAS